MITCPSCRSVRTWKDGLRTTRKGEIQRYICRDCGYRFSEGSNSVICGTKNVDPIYSPPPPILENRLFNGSGMSEGPQRLHTNALKRQLAITLDRRICACQPTGAKNLAKQIPQEEKVGAGATLDVKGCLVNYEAKMIMNGLKSRTILGRLNVLRLLMKRGVNLLDPVSVFKAIDHAKRYDHATKDLLDKEWTDGSKNNAAQAYKTFCEAVGIQISKDINFNKWSKRQQKLPWIPLEKEIDALIAGCSRKIAAFLQLLKEVWCRSGEAWRLEWKEVDPEHNVITINAPEKNGLPRQFKVSSKLIAMVNMLPKTSHRVFGRSTLTKLRQNFMIQRARTAHKLQNPRINRITFHTLRHWGATMEYHRTKDILHVQERLGHRSITSTLIYTHLINFEGDEYHTATSKSLEKDEELLKAGFEYVTERDGVKIYRKRK